MDTEKSYAPTYELTKYMKRAKRAEKRLLKKRERGIAEFDKIFMDDS